MQHDRITNYKTQIIEYITLFLEYIPGYTLYFIILLLSNCRFETSVFQFTNA